MWNFLGSDAFTLFFSGAFVRFSRIFLSSSFLVLFSISLKYFLIRTQILPRIFVNYYCNHDNF